MPANTSLTALRELWFHTGTACNLECPFCLEGSKPGDTRLERLTLNDIQTHIDAAVAMNVERFCFTGGEPLIVKDIVKILSYALQFKPCLVLTNGTAPLIKRVHQLQTLKAQPHALSFRVSIDFPNEKQHDTGRGWGNFKKAIDGLKQLHQAGFEISIARQGIEGEDANVVASAFAALLRSNHLPDVPVLALPEMGRPNLESSVGALEPTGTTMCSYSRMVLKQRGQVRVYACAFTDDDARFDMGSTLAEAAAKPVALIHHRCRQCVTRGAILS